jgi:D-3-phosphoglycerate dehydrogenase
VKILITEPEGYAPEALAIYRRLGEVKLGLEDGARLCEEAREAEALVVRLGFTIDAPLIRAAPSLRAVVSPTTGLDHLDLEALGAAGIEVISLRGETAFLRSIAATGELTWALVLAVHRRLVAAAADVRGGRWRRDPFRGRDLRGKTLGVLGVGRVGEMVAGYGRAFGMEVLGHDVRPFDAAFAEPVGWDALFARADVLSVHLPLDASTRGAVGAREIGMMKPGAVLVNTARGAIVDEAAVARALEAGHLGGAGLDVLAGEPALQREGLREAHPLGRLLGHPGLVITPHIGGASEDAMRATEIFCARRLAARLGAPAAQ